MASSPDFTGPDYFRKRAEEARTLAEEMEDAHTKLLMLGIADSYEQIAKSYEKVADWEKRLRDPNT